jgi:hypothetical protein
MTLDIDKESPICSNLSKAPEAHPSNAADPELPRYSRSLKISDFLQDWSKGLPVVITDLLIQGSWNPQYFIDAYGDLKADVVNCETGFIKKMFVRDYFQSFLDPSARVGIWKLKVDALSSFFPFHGFIYVLTCLVGLAAAEKFPGVVSRAI